MKPMIIATGNIGRVEAKTSANAKPFTVFSVASRYPKKTEEGTTYETEWTSFAAYGKIGEYIKNTTNPGDVVHVVGVKETRKYEQNGETKFTTNFIVTDFNPLHKKDKNGEATIPSSAIDGLAAGDDEIPF